jgi:hypothetical protein
VASSATFSFVVIHFQCVDSVISRISPIRLATNDIKNFVELIIQRCVLESVQKLVDFLHNTAACNSSRVIGKCLCGHFLPLNTQTTQHFDFVLIFGSQICDTTSSGWHHKMCVTRFPQPMPAFQIFCNSILPRIVIRVAIPNGSKIDIITLKASRFVGILTISLAIFEKSVAKMKQLFFGIHNKPSTR